MFIRHLSSCPEFIAGDDSKLREILNPRKEKIKTQYSLAWGKIEPRRKTLPHRLTYSEVYYILKGTGKIYIDNEAKLVKQNDTIYVPPNVIQFIENTGEGNLEFLCIVDPAWQPEAEHIIKEGK
jgi:mannose-6-phosphate isomerase-like protein (cupin superfamily)